MRELSPDRVSFLPGSDARSLILADQFQLYQSLVEGVWVLEHGGYYYLFFSGDNYCGSKEDNFTPHYAIMVARSKSATGPFETLAKATGAKSSVILEKNDRWDGPGHNSVVRDAAGQDWIFYHAIDPKNRVLSVPSLNYDFARRVMLMDKIEYKDGWPVIAGAPSDKELSGPVIGK